MRRNLHAERARAYLEELCDHIDRGRRPARLRSSWWSPPLSIPLAICMTFGVSSCGGSVSEASGTARSAEVCNNQVDDDGDQKIDCDDADCQAFAGCTSTEYAAPFEVCDNEIDDDGDSEIDCDDPDCSSFAGCESAPLTPEVCDNQVDDDGDGRIDCADFDCEEFPGCFASDYAAPFEVCDNQVDDDGDDKIDCADPDCETFPGCSAADYAAPFGP